MYTTREAAEYLKLSIGYLEALRQSGRGPIYHKLGRAVRYRKEDLDAWVDARRVA